MSVWGESGSPTLFLLHGWGDCGASFQFLVDELCADWRVIAPDWRGFGRTRCDADAYYFPDYLGDLDALLGEFAPDEPVTLVGHSMGANVAGLYSGVCPERVRALINIEGFGLPDAAPDEAPGRYRRWLEELRSPSQFIEYPSTAQLAVRIRLRSPRLEPARALFVAGLWARSVPGQRTVLHADPSHRSVNPVLYRRAEAQACWARIQAATLLVVGNETDPRYRGEALRDFERSLAAARRETVVIPECGHMVHFDQPARLAAAIEAFLAV